MTRMIILILLFSWLQGAAAEDTIPQKSTESNDKSLPLETQDEQPQQKPITWPSPFTPSQNVGADSQVAFPTDI